MASDSISRCNLSLTPAPAPSSRSRLRAAHEAEKAAADELAQVRGEYRHKWDPQGFRERAGPKGDPYVTTAEPAISLVLDGQPILTAAELVARLRASP